jgi:hypothetical protein
MSFTGTLRIKVLEASNLRPTDYQKRHEFGKIDKLIDPYISLDVDEKFIGKFFLDFIFCKQWRPKVENQNLGKKN